MGRKKPTQVYSELESLALARPFPAPALPPAGMLHHLHLCLLFLQLLLSLGHLKLIGQVTLCSEGVDLDVILGLLQLVVPLQLGHLNLTQILSRHIFLPGLAFGPQYLFTSPPQSEHLSGLELFEFSLRNANI